MEKLRNAFVHELHEKGIDNDMIASIVEAFDAAIADFDVTEKEVAITTDVGVPYIVKTFIASKHVEGLSENTLYNYMLALCRFFRSISCPVEKVTANMVRVYLNSYVVDNRVEAGTLECIRMTLSSFFTWAYVEGYIEKNPMSVVKPIKHEKKQRHSLTRSQLERIRRACETERELAIVDTLYSTGCRVSELVNIKINDIDFLASDVTVFGKGKKYRKVYLNASAMLSIRAYLETRDDDNPYLIVSERNPHHQVDRGTVRRIVQAIGNRAGVEKVSPHIFRHTTATMALRSGMPIQDIQKMLGHANISTTMIYAETNIDDIRHEHVKYVV